MGRLGTRLGRTVTGKPCPKCGSNERYEKTKQCAPCARRLAKEHRDSKLKAAVA